MSNSVCNFHVKHRRLFVAILSITALFLLFSLQRFREVKHTARSHVHSTPVQSDSKLVPFTSTRLVKYVHQTWKTNDLPPRFQRWEKSWKRCFPTATHLLWTDADNRRLIARYYPWFLSRFDSLPKPIYRADAIRYILMFHYGGIYTDLDNECLRPFDHLLAGKQVVFGAMSGTGATLKEGYVQNSFMYSTPRHPVWLDMVHHILDSKQTTLGALVGSWALANVVKDYRNRTGHHDHITVFPPKYFNPFSWKDNQVAACKHFNQMSEAEVSQCREAFRNTSYVIQYHAHTWGGGRIV